MPYTPPAANAADLNLTPGSYTPPAANAVTLNLADPAVAIDFDGSMLFITSLDGELQSDVVDIDGALAMLLDAYGEMTGASDGLILGLAGTIASDVTLAVAFALDLTAEAPIAHALFEATALLGQSSMQWSKRITVDAVDRSESIIGDIEIEAEEGAARIARFSFEAPTGAIEAASYLRKRVTIDFSPTPSQSFRRFTGFVIDAVYDPSTKQIGISASDDLQRYLESRNRAQIATLIGGYWSGEVFDIDANGWQYAQDRLSTIPASFDLDVYRRPNLTPWAANATADFTLTCNDVIDQTPQLDLARATDIKNTITLTLAIRYERAYQRVRSVGWVYPLSFGQYLQTPTTLPNQDMILSALDGTGWGVQQVAFTSPPPSGSYTVNLPGGGTAVVAWGYDPDLRLVMSYDAELVKRWTQTITETTTLTIRAPQSVTAYGEQATTDQLNLSPSFDWEAFEGFEGTPPTPGTVGLGPNNEWDVPAGFALNANGDYESDQLDTSSIDNDRLTAIAVARTQILKAHRRNTVEVQTPFLPVERSHTVRFQNVSGITAQGKVFHVRETYRTDRGEFIQQIKIAISRSNGASVTETALSAPVRPASLITLPPGTGGFNTSTQTQLGNHTGAIVYDPNADGYSGNYDPAQGIGEVFPVQFRVIAPAIPDAVREAAEFANAADFIVSVPNDTLTVTV